MSQTAIEVANTDRYVSFCGIECKKWSEELMLNLDRQLSASSTDNRWKKYFAGKLTQKKKMGHDNLFFIGAQMNTLYAFFEEYEDDESQALLWRLEQECC